MKYTIFSIKIVDKILIVFYNRKVQNSNNYKFNIKIKRVGRLQYMNQNQFTENSMLALQQAQEIAIKEKQQTIKPEFLALALLKNNEGLIPRIIEKLEDRKSVVQGKSVFACVDLGGRRIIKKKKRKI